MPESDEILQERRDRIAKIIFTARNTAGYTTLSLCESSGIASSTLRALEKAEDVAIAPTAWESLAMALRIPASVLLGELPTMLTTGSDGLIFSFGPKTESERSVSDVGARHIIHNPTLDDVLGAIGVHIKPVDTLAALEAALAENRRLAMENERLKKGDPE